MSAARRESFFDGWAWQVIDAVLVWMSGFVPAQIVARYVDMTPLGVTAVIATVLYCSAGYWFTIPNGSSLSVLNFTVLQWFGIRLIRTNVGTVPDGVVGRRFHVLRWIWPGTGWRSPFRWIGGGYCSHKKHAFYRWWT